MKGMGRFRIYLCVLWCVGHACDAGAQIFRKVTGTADIEVGGRYVLVAPVFQNEHALYVVTRQATTGTDIKKRAAQLFETDGQQRIHVDDTDIAVFELGQEKTAYTFRDVHNGGCLAYSTKKVSGNNTGLYTMTEEEISAVTSSSNPIYRTFKFDFSLKKTCVLTAQKVEVTGSSSGKNFYLLSSGSIGDSFRLYDKEDVAGTLYLYRELVPPVIDNEATGDWTFHGDWSVEDLSSKDYSRALRIDFTGIELPDGWELSGLSEESFPGEYVWTYVRQGEGDRLPEGWRNVIEVNPSMPQISGCAVTAVRGGDVTGVMAPKYPFRTKKGCGISWYRQVPADGGWLTVGLPFAVQTCTWATDEGEHVDVERREFSGLAGGNAVFRVMKDGEAWQAGVPYLWRPLVPMEGTVCFYADDTEVQTGDASYPDAPGFYSTFIWRDVDEGNDPVYLLDERGEKFVRAASGSRIAPGRGYLFLPERAERSVRLLFEEDASGCRTAMERTGTTVPVYTLTGVRVAEWKPGEPLPDILPGGMYVTPVGKLFKP